MANTSPGYGITIPVDGAASSQPVAQITQMILVMGASITALDIVESVLDKVVIDLNCDEIDLYYSQFLS